MGMGAALQKPLVRVRTSALPPNLNYTYSLESKAKCSRCKKPFAASTRKKYDRIVNQPYCNECIKLYRREHYYSNKAKYIERAAARNKRVRAELQAKLREYLSGKKCADCGIGDIRCLEFDHIGEKNFGISQALSYSQKSWDEILKEIAKCEIRCANCHRVKTMDMAGVYYRF